MILYYSFITFIIIIIIIFFTPQEQEQSEMDETPDDSAVVQRYFVDNKNIETDTATRGLVYQTVFHATSSRKTGNIPYCLIECPTCNCA